MKTISFAAIGMAACLSMLSANAQAGEFIVNCYSDVSNCATLIEDLVSDKFTRKFPSTKYSIVVLANFLPIQHGGGTGYAVVGVSPLKTGAGGAPMPIRRFSVTTQGKDDVIFGPEKQIAMQRDLIRSAVENLMDRCNQTPECDVMAKPER